MNFLLHALPDLRQNFRRQREYKRLRDMPDYLLEDIGLTREQVIRVTRLHPFRRTGS